MKTLSEIQAAAVVLAEVIKTQQEARAGLGYQGVPILLGQVLRDMERVCMGLDHAAGQARADDALDAVLTTRHLEAQAA